MSDDLATAIEVLRTTTGVAGGRAVETFINWHEALGVLHVDLDGMEFLKLISHCKPRIVYLHIDEFDALKEAIDDIADDGDDPDEISRDVHVKALVRKWKAQNGSISWFMAAFVADSVLHVSQRKALWLDGFESELAVIKRGKLEELKIITSRKEEETSARLRVLASQLREHPKFRGSPKPSVERHTYLAKELFPKFDDRTIRKIVEEARNREWLGEGQPA